MLAEGADLAKMDLSVVAPVIGELVERDAEITRLMVVGAHCRNLWAQALGRGEGLAATHDLDLGMAVDTMSEWAAVTRGLPRVSKTHSGIAFTVAGQQVDLMPFGEGVEQPSGTVEPPSRPGEPFSVLGFEDVFAAGVPLPLEPGAGSLRVPTPEGLCVLKIAAFHDRRPAVTKDAQDLALVLSWYVDSDSVREHVYTSEHSLLEEADWRPDVAAAALCGRTMRRILSSAALPMLLGQWEVSREAAREVVWHSRQLTGDRDHIAALVTALDRGLHDDR